MFIISHRGCLNGPDPANENSPAAIDKAIAAGLGIEVDIRLKNGKFYLGHDTPDYYVSDDWLLDRRDYLWLHAKDILACHKLLRYSALKFFCHTQDPFTMVGGFIWVHDLSLPITNRCIIPLITQEQLATLSKYKPFAVCTDYPSLIK